MKTDSSKDLLFPEEASIWQRFKWWWIDHEPRWLNWFREGPWYRFKCFIWYRYTTIKPRTLDHTWCDRSELLPHMMMQILTDFVEKEQAFDSHIDWDCNPTHKKVKEELLRIYHWWHHIYLTTDPWEDFYARAGKDWPTTDYTNLNSSLNQEGWSEEEKLLHNEARDHCASEEERLIQELTDNCIQLIRLRGYLWT